MHIKLTHNSPTSVTVVITANTEDLAPIKDQVVQRLGAEVKLPGFRPGKAPQALIEKNIDPATLQSQVIEEAINRFYVAAADQHNLRPVAQPEIAIKKFVPFTDLEFEAKVDVIGEVKLPDYTKMSKTAPTVKLTDKDVTEVIESLRQRMAEGKEVTRAAKNGDRVTLDFKGVDAKGEPVQGAEGKDYPLTLGSNSFIPGFEDNVVGVKAGEEKTFTIPFPKDYGVKALAGKKVTFTITATKVEELVVPKVDDAFAQQAGPFKTLADLKKDIKTQLTAERQQQADREFQQELVDAITAKTKVDIPAALIEEQLDAAEREERQNLMYRGETWEEHLKNEGVTDDQHREKNRDKAAARVKASLMLSEVAEQQKLQVTPEELEIRMQLLKGQYQDPAMQAELDKPETRRDIANRILTEKTIEHLTKVVTKK